MEKLQVPAAKAPEYSQMKVSASDDVHLKQDTAAGKKKFKIVSYNVHQWTDGENQDNVERVYETLAPLKADIIGLQEVMEPHKDESPITKGESPLVWLSKKLNMPYYYYGPELKFKGGGYYGNAILSRYPWIKDPENHKVGGSIAGLIIAEISLPNCKEPLRFGNTHLEPVDESLRVKQSEKAVQLLTGKTAENQNSNLPHIVVGDFNAFTRSDYDDKEWGIITKFYNRNGWKGPRADAMQIFETAKYKDSWALTGRNDPKNTCWTYNTLFRIDYIIASSNFPHKFVTYQRDNSVASDHFPVVAEFSCE